MATVFTEKQWCSSPVAYWKCDVTTTRSGQNVTYAFTFTVRFTGSYTWFNNGLAVVLSLDGTSKGQKQIKSQTSGQIGAKSYTLNWSETVSKTSGTTSFSATLKDTNTSNNRNSQTANLEVPAAGSSMGSVTAGTTLSGPTINVTRYDSNFYDVITLTYNNRTITRNGFTSSKLSFSEAERLTIFQAQGAGSTATWSISGNTYTDSTRTSWLGSYSGSVNITTEGLCSVTMANNFNVESNTQYSVSNPCGGTWDLYARVGGWGGTDVWSRTGVTGSASNATASPNATTIYNSNSSSKDGYVYWYIVTKINGTVIGSENSRYCTYYFVQSLCGPYFNDPGLQYKITDQGTKDLMGSSGSYYAYNNNTDLGKFIINKTTLTISYSASAQTGKNASISKYKVAVTGKSEVDRGTNTTYDIPALTTNGTVTVTAIDSRGYSVTRSFSYNLNDYWLPTFTSLSAVRNAMSASDPSADKIVKISTTISMPSYMISYIRSHTSSKDLHYEYSTNGSSYSANGTNLLSSCTVSGNTMTLTNWATTAIFDQNTQYYIRLSVDDYYTNNILSGAVVVPISAPLISRRSQKVGINKIPGSYTLDVGGTFHCDGNATIGGNASVGGIITSHGKQLQSYFSINLSSQSTSNFYPVTFLPGSEELECEIHSPGFSSSAAYNQNIIHFIVSSSGWSDTPVYINILNYKNYTDSEVAIGCIGKGNSGSYDVCVWLRGGFTYSFYSNFTPTLHTSSYTGGGSSPSTFTVGTNYYGGSNTNVTILFTPQSTITKGSYQSDNITAGGTVTAGTDVRADGGFLYSVNNGVTTKIGGGNSSFSHYYSTSGKHWFDHPVYVAGDIYGGSSYNKKVAYYEQIPTNNNQLTNGAGYTTFNGTFGSSGIWSWIRFSNGYTICWGTVDINTAINTAWGNVFESGAKSLGNWPFTWSETPTVTYSMVSLGGYSAWMSSSNGTVTTTSVGNVTLNRPGSKSVSSQPYKVSVIAIGKY